MKSCNSVLPSRSQSEGETATQHTIKEISMLERAGESFKGTEGREFSKRGGEGLPREHPEEKAE